MFPRLFAYFPGAYQRSGHTILRGNSMERVLHDKYMGSRIRF